MSEERERVSFIGERERENDRESSISMSEAYNRPPIPHPQRLSLL